MRKKEIQKREERAGEISWEGERGEREREREREGGRERIIFSHYFQVMECCWARLVKKVEVAEDLDQVIDAHDSFLEQITTQCLLDPESQVPLTKCMSTKTNTLFLSLTLYQSVQYLQCA